MNRLLRAFWERREMMRSAPKAANTVAFKIFAKPSGDIVSPWRPHDPAPEPMPEPPQEPEPKQ